MSNKATGNDKGNTAIRLLPHQQEMKNAFKDCVDVWNFRTPTVGYCFSSRTGKLYSLTLPQVVMHEYECLVSEGREIWSLAEPREIGPDVPRPPAELLTTGGPELYLSFKQAPPDAKQIAEINKAIDETVGNLKLSKRVEKTLRDLPILGKLWVLQHFTPEAGADENDQMRTYLDSLGDPWERAEKILRVDTVGGDLGRHIPDLSQFGDLHQTKQCRVSWNKKQHCFQLQALHGLVIVDGRELDRGEKVNIKNKGGQIQLGRRCFMRCDVRDPTTGQGDQQEAVAQPIVETSGGAFGMHSNYARKKIFSKTEDERVGEKARAQMYQDRSALLRERKRRLEGYTGWKEGLREAKLRKEERELEMLERTEETEANREIRNLNMNPDGSFGGVEAEAARPGLGYTSDAASGAAPRSLMEKRMVEVASGASKPSVTSSNPFRMAFVKSSKVLNATPDEKKKKEEEEVDMFG